MKNYVLKGSHTSKNFLITLTLVFYYLRKGKVLAIGEIAVIVIKKLWKEYINIFLILILVIVIKIK